jgi:diguanylate cyclase (GGDEF)-like protein
MGGEEFAVLMPETTMVQALNGAERLRRAVEATPFVMDGIKFSITISLGARNFEKGTIPTGCGREPTLPSTSPSASAEPGLFRT